MSNTQYVTNLYEGFLQRGPDAAGLALSNTQYVTNLYEGFLQRGPDAAGLGWWAGQATVGQGRQNVLNAFAASSAFRELAGTLYREAYWLVADHLGTPRMIVSKSGTLAGVKRHDYLPFGEELGLISGRTQAMGYSAIDNVRQKFTQKERDNETGLDYFLARYYSSTQGRFTSPDEFKGGPEELFIFVDAAAENPTFYAELDQPQSLNKYQYTYNNPLRYTDPTGHCVGALTFLRPLCIKAGTKVIERATPYVAAGVGALAGAAARIGEGNTGDPSCPACGSSERMGQSLMKRNEQRRQSQQQNQNQSNTASPNPGGDKDKKPIFGEKGTQTTSTTVGSGKGWRVDVENPNPGQRPGQIHYQSGDTKLLYDPSTKSFVGASKTQNRQLMNDPQVQRAIKKGMKMLGESQ